MLLRYLGRTAPLLHTWRAGTSSSAGNIAIVQLYLWPSNSPGLNPVDEASSSCEFFFSGGYVTSIKLKQRLLHVWRGRDQSIID